MGLENSPSVTRSPLTALVRRLRPFSGPVRLLVSLADASHRMSSLAFTIDRFVAVEMGRRPEETKACKYASR